MPAERFRVALIGAGGFGRNMLRALCDCPLVELVGVSDLDASAASSASAEAGCPVYIDHRRLLVETRPAGAFLTVPPAPSAELVRLASHCGSHVWKESPLARNLHEAVSLCRLTESAGRRFVIGTQRRFMGGYRRGKELLGRLGKVYLVQAHYLFNLGAVLGWRGDKAAGGGALINLGYHVFDLVVWLMGLPETVYAVAGTRQPLGGSQGRPAGSPAGVDQPVYDTEDTVSVAFRYTDKAAAVITVSRCFDPVSEGLLVYGEGGSLSVGPDRCLLRDRDGAAIETFQADERPAAVFAREVEAFVRASAGSVSGYPCSGWENLLTMAAIEAAYLSDRTHQPESPAALLAGHEVAARDCLRFAPVDEANDQ